MTLIEWFCNYLFRDSGRGLLQVFAVVAVVGMLLLCFAIQPLPHEFVPRKAEGPGGYLDYEYNQLLNTQQTGKSK
jgi:hypothetical protein